MQAYQLMRLGTAVGISIVLAKSGLSAAEIGVYEMLLYVGTILSFFWVNGLLQGIPPLFQRKTPEAQARFYTQIFIIFSALAVGLYLLLTLGESRVCQWLTGREALPYFKWYALFLLFNLPTYPVEYFYLVQGRPWKIAFWGLAGLGGQFLAVALPVWAGSGMELAMQALAAVGLLKFLWALGLVLRLGSGQWQFGEIRDYLRFSWPLTLNVLAGNIIVLFDSWLVSWYYHDEAMFAIYRYGSREFPLATALATALGVVMSSRISADREAGLQELKRRSTRLMHTVFPITIGLLFVAPLLFPLVFNPDFAASAPLFNIYLLVTASRVLLPNAVVLALGAPQMIFRWGLVELVLKVLSGFIFIHFWGLPGVAWSVVLTFWVEKIGLSWYLQRQGIRPGDWLPVRVYFFWIVLLAAAYMIFLRCIIQ